MDGCNELGGSERAMEENVLAFWLRSKVGEVVGFFYSLAKKNKLVIQPNYLPFKC